MGIFPQIKIFNNVLNVAIHSHVPLYCRHEKSQSREKTSVYTQYLKAFACDHHLHRHEKTHTRLKPYEGNKCDKAFSHHSHLQMHKGTYTREMPYKCNQCCETFAHYHTLQMHKKCILERNPMNVISVVMSSHGTVIFKVMKEAVLDCHTNSSVVCVT